MDSVLSNEVARRIAADLATLVSEAEKHGTLPRIKSVAFYFNETELRTIIKLMRSRHGILDPAQPTPTLEQIDAACQKMVAGWAAMDDRDRHGWRSEAKQWAHAFGLYAAQPPAAPALTPLAEQSRRQLNEWIEEKRQKPAAPVETELDDLREENKRLHKRIETVITERLNVEYACVMDAKRQVEKENEELKARLQCSSAGTGEAWNPTDEQVRSACMWYRHDMGLLTVSEAAAVKTEARLWLRAWQKEIAGIRAVPQSLWQPIETAPQDGTRILATGGGLGKEVEAVTYNERVGCWSAETCTLDDTDHEPDGYNRPTHWQPMPDASALSRPQLEAGSTELPSHQGKAP